MLKKDEAKHVAALRKGGWLDVEKDNTLRRVFETKAHRQKEMAIKVAVKLLQGCEGYVDKCEHNLVMEADDEPFTPVEECLDYGSNDAPPMNEVLVEV
ncbi:hypothetical protein V6N12_036172 [Hibiscus sabdariffa]|uniref:Uncharacterized protein n=1 Tax=Hibiscus sabdariffa TaxID=183260 RepID=A0ABR2EPV1_9ROSI